jgi:hypothetical protein
VIERRRGYVAYLLRIWQPSEESPPGAPPQWRASLESPQSHEVQGFAGLDELFDHLRKQIDPAQPEANAAAGEGSHSERR